MIVTALSITLSSPARTADDTPISRKRSHFKDIRSRSTYTLRDLSTIYLLSSRQVVMSHGIIWINPDLSPLIKYQENSSTFEIPHFVVKVAKFVVKVEGPRCHSPGIPIHTPVELSSQP
ncbi:hypothetical protein AVEN_192947-1 [Araneus ventricosus]|uniref:Uncharacterized protein n=1 Tax=Araneus ventricosus TaxID=182803 RepID=A0A4Y2X793_ARAVE|nr:hypothetical protein AVEN_192947-1 [Araneus ventricosus]